MSEFITDVEQQYEVYCKIAENYGFIDLNAKKNGFRCTTKSNEFNAGWVAFTGAIAAMREDQQSEIDRLNSVLDERTKEWLQAIECGTYFENVAKPLRAENDQLKSELALCREENKGLVGKVSWMQGQVLELETKHKTKNERIMKLVSIFTSLSSQTLCEEPELSDEFYKKFDEFHSVLINIEL